MHKKITDITTSHNKPHKACVIGNVAIARGAIEAGVEGVFSYPGTPSTEISEVFSSLDANRKKLTENNFAVPYFEYSINEKIALEKAIAFSIGNKSAMCVMKNVGMNVASDPLMSITYQTIVGPLIIVLCDDPGCHSSSNEQDSRHWGTMASVPIFNPATPAESLSMVADAFKLSEILRLPVIVRTTTRVSHTRGNVVYNTVTTPVRIPHFDRLPEHINIPARTATAHQKLLTKLQSSDIDIFFYKNNVFLGCVKAKHLIISSGVSTTLVNEIINSKKWQNEVAHFSIGLLHPFPTKQVQKLLSKGFKKVLILEELDPIIENAVRIIAQTHKIQCEISGKGYAGIKVTGEFNLEIIRDSIEQFCDKRTTVKTKGLLNNYETLLSDLPARPPALCAGCPHRATYYTLKLAVPHDNEVQKKDQDIVLCGDIGCFGLGALAPLKMVDTINHMGMSISMAQGLSEALKTPNTQNTSTIAMLGDGTFFHSGIPALLNAVYTNSRLLVIIFDNRTIGMTGHQEHPGATHQNHHQIDIESLVKGMGVTSVTTVSPFNIGDTYRNIQKGIDEQGVSVIISKSPCVFLPEYSDCHVQDNKYLVQRRVVVDPTRCNTCHNHTDIAISCSRIGSPDNSLNRARAKLTTEINISAHNQQCPANICNHGFLQAIRNNEPKNALEMVRDKMLFARSCGDICHRPCELFAGENAIPIKALKKYVSGIESHFKDLSRIKSIVNSTPKKNKNIAIVGAGPSGLSCAYDLVKCGYKITIFEKENIAGGLVRFAIPDFRMDKKGFDFEVKILEELGVTFKFNSALGKDISMEHLTNAYDAVMLAIGLGKPISLPNVEEKVPSEKLFNALKFLKLYNTQKLKCTKGVKYLVIGGGNSAIDVARATINYDNSAVVTVVCIESRSNMPAFDEEIEKAIDEGVTLLANTEIATCKAHNSNIAITLRDFETKEEKTEISPDFVIVAIGQTTEEMDIDKNTFSPITNHLLIDENTGLVMGNIFAAGDLCDGNSQSVIGAIAAGKRAAVGIRKLLENYKFDYEGIEALTRLNTESPGYKPVKSNHNEDLKNIQNWNLFQACQKCNHCIDNFGCPALVKEDGKVVVDSNKCTNCGLCIEVCPNDAIHWEKVTVEI